MTKKILLALITATQAFSVCHATAQQTTVSGTVVSSSDSSGKKPIPTITQVAVPAGHFLAPNNKVIKNSDAEKIGGEDGAKGSRPIALSNVADYLDPIQCVMPPPYPKRSDYAQESYYQAALEQHNQMLKQLELDAENRRKIQQAQIQVNEARSAYCKAYNEAWAKANPGK